MNLPRTPSICVVIPCYNEEQVLETTLLELQGVLLAFPNASVLVCDDGSSDNSIQVARACGVEVLAFAHRGLGATIRVAFEVCRTRKFDFVITLDADGQYHPNSISAMLEPLILGQTDVSLGQRNPNALGHQTPIRRFFHTISTIFMRIVTGINFDDAGTGFRAYNQYALDKLEIQSDYDHTAETLLQLQYHQLRVALVPIQSRLTPRASKLVTNHFIHALKEVTLFFQALWRYRKRP
jgi:glycosyltransferase involved in cell wall biosynthesis